MLTEYVCAVKNGHRQSCGSPQTPTPECCGQPMLLLQSAPLSMQPQPKRESIKR